MVEDSRNSLKTFIVVFAASEPDIDCAPNHQFGEKEKCSTIQVLEILFVKETLSKLNNHHLSLKEQECKLRFCYPSV